MQMACSALLLGNGLRKVRCEMPSNSALIFLAIRLRNDQYKAFHAIIAEIGATKAKVIRMLIDKYIKEHSKKS